LYPQNGLDVCAAYPDLLLSASADETVRVTNMHTGVPLVVLFGDQGHVAEVLDVAWHPTKPWLVASVGLDNAIIIWSLQTVCLSPPSALPEPAMTRMLAPSSGQTAYARALATTLPCVCVCACRHRTSDSSRLPRHLQVFERAENASAAADIFVHVCHPLFHSKAVHADFVDSVTWFGDALLTKSVHDEVVLWCTKGCLESTLTLGTALGAAPPGFVPLRRFLMHGCTVWFLKLTVSLPALQLACGSTKGKVFIWELPGEVGAGHEHDGCVAEVIEVARGVATVRSVALHLGGALVAGMDNGLLSVHVRR
jgi:WD40 repeat protein